MEEKSALWRRISTDEYYIISREYGGYFIEGTQNEDKIQQLWDKIWNYISMEIVADISERVPVHTLRREGMEIVKASKEVFDKIQNKHWFSNLKNK